MGDDLPLEGAKYMHVLERPVSVQTSVSFSATGLSRVQARDAEIGRPSSLQRVRTPAQTYPQPIPQHSGANAVANERVGIIENAGWGSWVYHDSSRRRFLDQARKPRPAAGRGERAWIWAWAVPRRYRRSPDGRTPCRR